LDIAQHVGEADLMGALYATPGHHDLAIVNAETGAEIGHRDFVVR